MKIEFNSLRLNEQAVLDGIYEVLNGAIDYAVEGLIKEMAHEIVNQGAGKTRWRMEAALAFKEKARDITRDYIEATVGISDGVMSDEDLRARLSVALFGNQARGNIRSKPGEIVYGNTMEGDLHLSGAQTSWDIPQFDQYADGEKMLENAMKLTKKYLNVALEAAALRLQGKVFYKNVSVVRK